MFTVTYFYVHLSALIFHFATDFMLVVVVVLLLPFLFHKNSLFFAKSSLRLIEFYRYCTNTLPRNTCVFFYRFIFHFISFPTKHTVEIFTRVFWWWWCEQNELPPSVGRYCIYYRITLRAIPNLKNF